jgi:isoleucyl-tRNA synthetase
MSGESINHYPEIPSQPNYPSIEEEIIKFWDADSTFQTSIDIREGNKEIVFYDGPPFANGLPHYGHLLTGFVKDAMPRYFTMRGNKVQRRFGWDCHGLPAETEAEKNLHVVGRNQINSLGVDVFNNYCRTSVMKYVKEWEYYVKRSGRWVDFENDYKTMDMPFMESVIWAFAELHKNGLIYEDYRVLPYCWECETPLSNFETRQDDAYRERLDTAATVLFELTQESVAKLDLLPKGIRTKIGVWTTTPWTLPSNLALAVGRDISYVLVQRDVDTAQEILIIAEARYTQYSDMLENPVILGTVMGHELVSLDYIPLFGYFANTQNAFVVLEGDFVSTEEGTGIVHLAPGFGEDDQRVCTENAIPIVCPVDSQGRFEDTIGEFKGLQVFDANEKIISHLKEQAAVLGIEQYAHNYPHCWRTDTPLIYKAVSSFFVNVTRIRERMVELNSSSIRFQPEHIGYGSFGNWLKGARDWSITRNRFWGSPIPVWKSDNPDYPRTDVYGSLDELERDFGVRPTDLHRPEIDKLIRPNPDDPSGKSMMRRVEDVLDCWFDSGAMPFAQLHYPIENKDHFERNFPADFICEYIGQTRGWFYSLHVLATALFDKPAFSNCIAHGVVLGNDGRKLSKRLKNYPDPEEFFREVGADAMRWYLLSSPVLRGQDVVMEKSHMAEPAKQILNPIYNAWYFLSLYGRSDKTVGQFRTDQNSLMDFYILAKMRILIRDITNSLDQYDIPGALAPIANFLDALTNWYIRRSRERFWRPNPKNEEGSPANDTANSDTSQEDTDKQDAYDTLHTVIETLSQLMAPFLPFLTEHIYKDITGRRSVHLSSWPSADIFPDNTDLVDNMDLVREICSQAHSIRKAAGIRARLPLASITIISPRNESLRAYSQLILEEVNCKNVIFDKSPDPYINKELSIIPAVLGPRVGDKTQEIIKDAKKGNYSFNSEGLPVVAGVALKANEYKLALKPFDTATTRVVDKNGTIIAMDLEITDKLLSEGITRDLTRHIQQARREANLMISDRINLILALDEETLKQLCIRKEAVTERVGAGELVTIENYLFIDEIKQATLANKVYLSEMPVSENNSSEDTLHMNLEKMPFATQLSEWFHKSLDMGENCQIWLKKSS